MTKNARFIAGSMIIFAAGFVLGNVFDAETALSAQGDKVYELRTYTTMEGKLPNLEARFRDHTMRIFEKHGISNVGYWVPEDAPASDNTLIYIIEHDTREAAETSWASFRADPEWTKVAEASQVDGRIVSNVESVFMSATDYSPIR